MTTVHSTTATRRTVCSPQKTGEAVAAAGDLVPFFHRCGKSLCVGDPREMKGKLTGMAFRRANCWMFPVVDLTCRLEKSTTYEEICAAIKEASRRRDEDVGYADSQLGGFLRFLYRFQNFIFRCETWYHAESKLCETGFLV